MLPEPLKHALNRALQHPPVLVASDFDGTLAPFTTNPLDSRLLPEAAQALAGLVAYANQHPDRLQVALVSGRQLDVLFDLAQPPDGTALIASHGAQVGVVRGGQVAASGENTELTATQRGALARLEAELTAIAGRHPGTQVEVKALSVALHTRGADSEVGASAMAQARAAGKLSGLELLSGNQVLEFLVAEETKGTALMTLRAKLGAGAVIYLGDDVTDETALATLRPEAGDVGIKIGDASSVAQYRLPDVAAAAGVLTELHQAVLKNSP